MSKHRWGPVVQFGQGRMMTRCLNAFCDMDLSLPDVPESDRQTAAEFLRQMEPNADRSFKCPMRKSDLYEKVIVE